MVKNAKNLRRGENHPEAKLTDHEVELIRQFHEDEGYGYKRLAKKFETPIRTIRDICNYVYR